MQVGKLSLAGVTDRAKPRTACNALASTNCDAPFAQVTVLRLPATAMVNDKTIAAFTAGRR